jgi:hypothetical protein
MILLENDTDTISASAVISHSTENASLSTSARREHISSVRGLGNISMRRSTMYTDVPLWDASSSRGVPGCTKFVTSAISIMHPETDQGIKSTFCVLRWAD